MFAHDEETASLHRQATVLKNNGDWAGAIRTLEAAKARMLISPVSYPIETWCRLPFFLQYAGRFEEAMQEFDFLINDVERRARHELSFYGPKSPEVKQAIKVWRELLKRERKRVEARELRRLKKLPTALPCSPSPE